MKATLLVAALCAAPALSKPLVHAHKKRDWDFVTDYETTYTTVTAAAPTGGSGNYGWWSHWGSWGHPAASQTAPAEAFTTVYTTMTGPAVPVVTNTPMDEGTPTFAPTTTAAPAAPVTTDWSSSAAPAAPAPASSSAAAVTGGVSQGTGPGGLDIAAMLEQHNNHRRNSTDIPDLVWSTDMANIAAQIASSCVYAHNTQAGGGGYGQNIGAGASPSDSPGMITNSMFNGEINWYPQPYGNNNPDMTNFEHWGHYSQIMWKSTTSVGCAIQDCSGQGLANTGSGVEPWFLVCNYDPPGNFGGEYANVGAPAGQPSVTV